MIPDLGGIVVFMRMFTGMDSFVLLAIPLFILVCKYNESRLDF